MDPTVGDELVDVVAEDDRVLGQTTRREMRLRNLRHRSVYVLVFNHEAKLFVHQRTATKDIYPSRYDVTIGGVVCVGESYEEAASREFGEELGVLGSVPTPLFSIRYRDEHTTVNGMVFREINDGPFVLQATEIMAGEFVTLDEVAARACKLPFCPDGLAVLTRYRASGVDR